MTNDTNASTNTDTNTVTNTATNTTTNTATNTATQSSTQTTTTNVKISKDGVISINGTEASNSDLSDYYNNITGDKATIVKGVLNNNRVTIDGTTYVTELNEKGELVSVDGTKTLSQSKVIESLGDEGYQALVTKTTKNVTVGSDGKITIEDKENAPTLTIDEVNTETNESNDANNSSNNDANNSSNNDANNSSNNNADNSSNNESSNTKSTTSSTGGYTGGSTVISTGGSSSGYTGGSTSSSSSSSTGSSSAGTTGTVDSSSSDTENQYNFKTSVGNNSIIMVEFSQLESIKSQLESLSSQIKTVGDDYSSTITGLQKCDSAWSGVDKDSYITNTTGYSTNMGELQSTLGEFVTYLGDCLTRYKELESKLAAKFS